MNSREMKRIVAEKLEQENCGFTYKDIFCRARTAKLYEIGIRGYEHHTFVMRFDNSELFGHEVEVTTYEWDFGHFAYSKTSLEIAIKEALIMIGYCIGTTF